MKKILNLFLICSVLAVTTAPVLSEDVPQNVIAKTEEKVQIVKPEKPKKVNKRRERKKILKKQRTRSNLQKKPKECMKQSSRL